jgi:hypothetical protein
MPAHRHSCNFETHHIEGVDKMGLESFAEIEEHLGAPLDERFSSCLQSRFWSIPDLLPAVVGLVKRLSAGDTRARKPAMQWT